MPKGRQKDRLERALKAYFKEIHGIYTGGGFSEESFYPALKGLVEECSRLLLKVTNSLALKVFHQRKGERVRQARQGFWSSPRGRRWGSPTSSSAGMGRS